jgi:ADP-ribosylglycohydrolase
LNQVNNVRNLLGLLGDELTQRRQSGYDVGDGLADKIHAAVADGGGATFQEAAGLYEQLDQTGLRAGWEYEEPSALDDIIAAAPEAPAVVAAPGGDELSDRVLAAWLGRCAGCNLGKPVEGHGWNRAKLREYLAEAKAYPLADYIPVLDPMPGRFTLHPSWPAATRGRIDAMARDDDLDYTMLGLKILEKYGPGYTSSDVGSEWVRGMPYEAVYTAERVAYRNLVTGLVPPETARYRNPYREWIGAMIRADIFGYVSPGDPTGAARLAYQDAALSHTANGIYGEMWAAALIAASFTSSDAREAIEQAMLVVPARSRLSSSLRATIDSRDAGQSWDQAMDSMQRRLDGYHWVHTINNAEVVTAALLWGDGDFSRTIGLAVEAALDTDCDGATAGSVFGALHGTRAIPAHWTEPLHDTIHSALLGFDGAAITSLARRTTDLAAAGTSARRSPISDR